MLRGLCVPCHSSNSSMERMIDIWRLLLAVKVVAGGLLCACCCKECLMA
jgi:hypothetical protein